MKFLNRTHAYSTKDKTNPQRRRRLEAAWTVAQGRIGCVAAAAVAAHLPTLRKLVRPAYVQ